MKLAFTGEAGSGKDYIVEHLIKDYGYMRVSFSDQLKKLAHTIYPWMKKDYSPQEKEQPLNIEVNGELITMTPRQIWLHLNKLRDVEDGLFVRMLQDEMNLLNVENIVISDIRTQNELDWCIRNGFTTVYVHNEQSAHPQNDFDDFARSLRGKTDYFLDNPMNGPQFIHDFMEVI